MRSLELLYTIFGIITTILFGSLTFNIIKDAPLLGLPEFGLIGLLIFLVISDEWIKLKVSTDGIEIDQKEH